MSRAAIAIPGPDRIAGSEWQILLLAKGLHQQG